MWYPGLRSYAMFSHPTPVRLLKGDQTHDSSFARRVLLNRWWKTARLVAGLGVLAIRVGVESRMYGRGLSDVAGGIHV